MTVASLRIAETKSEILRSYELMGMSNVNTAYNIFAIDYDMVEPVKIVLTNSENLTAPMLLAQHSHEVSIVMNRRFLDFSGD